MRYKGGQGAPTRLAQRLCCSNSSSRRSPRQCYWPAAAAAAGPHAAGFCFRCSAAGRKALTTSSCVSMYGPSSRSMQAGMDTNTCRGGMAAGKVGMQQAHGLGSRRAEQAGNRQHTPEPAPASTDALVLQMCTAAGGAAACLPTSSIVSRMLLGLPGKFRMSDLPRSPAVWRDSTAVGTYRKLQVQGPVCCYSKLAGRRGRGHQECMRLGGAPAEEPSTTRNTSAARRQAAAWVAAAAGNPAGKACLIARICSPYPGIMRSHTCRR